jgi:hypothetical protein
VKEGEYGRNMIYSCMKIEMRPAETLLRMVEKENDGGGEFNQDTL